jgi:acyl-CoA reductase-like NAD-dependent aldehyde dehydrogenase
MTVASTLLRPFESTTRAELDAAVAALQERKAAWAATSVRERIALIRELRHDFLAVSGRWTAVCMEAEGLEPDSLAAGEEALVGPYMVLRNLRLLQRSLEEIERYGRPRIPGPVRTRPDGQVTARVFPLDIWDRIFYPGVTAEVWMQPGVTRESLPETMAVAYHARPRTGGVALVLGAGNVSSIGPMDALYKLFVEDQVVIYKNHPVNAYLGPLLEEAFRCLGSRGFFQVAYGGAEEGAYLCRHPGIDEIHITGSDRTYEAIVFGPGDEGQRNKERGTPVLHKRVTAELGNVSPVIVTPGPWSDAEIAYHAENLVTMLVNNAGFNCNATRVIVVAEGWPLRAKLAAAMRQILAKIPTRRAYYPGAADRFQQFLAAHPTAEQWGSKAGDHLPWMLISGLDPARKNDICFTTEAFCGVFAEVALPASTAAEFLPQAVSFANDTLWGSLNATLLIHPDSLKDQAAAQAFELAVSGLRYGTVSVNHWAATGYGLVVTPWGAFPGHHPQDIQSGVGVVHNTLMFDQAQKGVVRAPFRTHPKPVWFATHRTSGRLTPILTRFEAEPSFARLPRIFGLALRG